jgi:hypothetical protein
MVSNKIQNQNLGKQSFVGCDPELISINEWKEWKETLEQSDKKLVPIQTNLIDILWANKRPHLPNEHIWKHDLQFSGFSFSNFILILFIYFYSKVFQ